MEPSTEISSAGEKERGKKYILTAFGLFVVVEQDDDFGWSPWKRKEIGIGERSGTKKGGGEMKRCEQRREFSGSRR